MLGIDLAGRVVRAGEDAPFSEGDEVFGRQQLGRMVRFMQYTMISFVFFPFLYWAAARSRTCHVYHFCIALYYVLILKSRV